MGSREPLLTRPFLLAAVSHFFHALAYYLYLQLPGFLKSAGATEVQIGLIFGATAATAIVTRPLIGRVMDLWGRRPVVLAGGAIELAACLLYLTVSDLGPRVVAVRIGHGLAEAMLFASLFAVAADVVPASRRIEGIGLFGVSGMLPYALSSLLGDFILERGGYREVFLCSALFSGAGLALSLPLAESGALVSRERPRGFLSALAQRDLLPLWLVGLTFATAIAAPFTFLKTFVMDTGVGSVGGFFSAYGAAAVVVRVGLGSLPERVGPKRVLLPALVLTAAGSFLLAGAGSSAAVVAAGLLWGIGHGYSFPILLGLVVARARDSERGAALSIFTALFDAGALLGAPLLGALIRAAGYPVTFAAAGGVVLAGVVIFAAIDRR